jgi:hypothetical protein
LHTSFSTLLYRGRDTQPLCYNTGMFDFQSYRWYHWLMLTAFVISLPWLWALYLILGIIWLGGSSSAFCTGLSWPAHRSDWVDPSNKYSHMQTLIQQRHITVPTAVILVLFALLITL